MVKKPGVNSTPELAPLVQASIADRYTIGQHCKAYGFHSDLTQINNVPIATITTAWSDPHTGESYIIIINEALYFGDGMDHSLVNPNQIRAFRIELYDNPYEPDPNRSMGVMLNDYKKLPFRSDGSTIYFNTWYPTDKEMDAYEHIIVTSDQPWDPQGLVMPGGDNLKPDMNDERFVQHMHSNIAQCANQHHRMYESDCVAFMIDGNTEQLLCERMIQSARVTEN